MQLASYVTNKRKSRFLTILTLRVLAYYCISKAKGIRVLLYFQRHLKMLLKQTNFERNTKNILGFENFSLQIRDIEKISS
jgi:hypothetical protein